jgi:hypothetical protein
VKIFDIHRDFIEDIMTRAEWICNDCDERFETKGKRDGHRERTHRQTGFNHHGITRSENGKFVCKCGREYMAVQSLKCHRKHCEVEFPSNEVNPDENIEEGIRRLKMENADYRN